MIVVRHVMYVIRYVIGGETTDRRAALVDVSAVVGRETMTRG